LSNMPDPCLRRTPFLDFDHPDVLDFARRNAGTGSPREMAVRLNLAVRDGIRYDPYSFRLEPQAYRASHCLAARAGFCVPKAILLAACARAVGIPSRLGYANVRNHLSSPRLSELMGSDIFRWHGYTLLQIDGNWLKATPAFDLALCERFGVNPLEFDGMGDSVFHQFDASGRRHMEYLDDLGEFDDFPQAAFLADMRTHYPRMIEMLEAGVALKRESADDRFGAGS